MLKAKQRSAAGALLGLALNQAQIHQSNELKSSTSRDSASEGARLWVHQSSDLLRPVFRSNFDVFLLFIYIYPYLLLYTLHTHHIRCTLDIYICGMFPSHKLKFFISNRRFKHPSPHFYLFRII